MAVSTVGNVSKVGGREIATGCKNHSEACRAAQEYANSARGVSLANVPDAERVVNELRAIKNKGGMTAKAEEAE